MQSERRSSSPTKQHPGFNWQSSRHSNDLNIPRRSEDAATDAGSQPRLSSDSFPSIMGNSAKADRWQPRKLHTIHWTPEPATLGPRRSRQKSLSEAIRTIKGRRASVSESAHEIAEALKAPISPTLIMLCMFWFMTSIFSNASSKSILIAFRKPVTLTLVQFAFVSSWCIISSQIALRYPSIKTMIPALRYPIRKPTKDLIMTTLPLTAFQIGGHVLNSDAMSRIPVSLVHTIKGLSPLFTVLAYRFVFRVHYSMPTYLSLIPLTLGVIMSCSADTTDNLMGLATAFGSAMLFVTQNIVSKRLFNEAARAEVDGPTTDRNQKPDKLNLLCYSSGLAFLITCPLWFWSEGTGLIQDVFSDGHIQLSGRPGALDHGRLAMEFIFNGTFHFAQSLVAFVLLSMVNPVTYSVASLIKRVFVILFAIVWFGNAITRVQAAGIGLTFLGLYLYDRTNDASKASRRRLLQERRVVGGPLAETPVLPLIKEDALDGGFADRDGAKIPFDELSPTTSAAPPHVTRLRSSPVYASPGPIEGGAVDEKMLLEAANAAAAADPERRGSGHSPSNQGQGWLAPGTRQEHTWNDYDRSKVNGSA